GIITLIDGIHSARYMRSNTTASRRAGLKPATTVGAGFTPARRGAVAVFCPCKGVDHEFEKNIRSILDQDFEDFTVYFVVDSPGDPASGLLRSIGATHILIAGPATDC